MDVEGNVQTIAARLRELGDAEAAERLETALAGSTSGEIYSDLGVEANGLVKSGYGKDAAIGPLLREMRDELNAVNHNPAPRAVVRRVLRVLRERFGRSDPA